MIFFDHDRIKYGLKNSRRDGPSLFSLPQWFSTKYLILTFLSWIPPKKLWLIYHVSRRVNEAAKSQLDKLLHCSNLYQHSVMYEYAHKLIKTLPSHLNMVYLVNSGSEANELAILLARFVTFFLFLQYCMISKRLYPATDLTHKITCTFRKMSITSLLNVQYGWYY
jgi:4-aminobutyrate aminotransferase and related aminotransferases